MPKPKALDLFSCAGGATRGLQMAGFHVTGVDIKPQPRYCGDEFHQADALTFPLDGFDFIWASPPCQAFTTATLSQRLDGKEYPDLVAPIRARLIAAGVPYCIENVIGAPLLNAFMLCGSMFGLRTWRHRLFETTLLSLPLLHPCNHTGIGIPVSGHNTPSWVRKKNGGKNFLIHEVRAAIGIDWMNRDEMAQAIPPAYSEWIGRQFRADMGRLSNA